MDTFDQIPTEVRNSYLTN